VPRRDGRIVIGATSEEVGFTPHTVGIQALLERAVGFIHNTALSHPGILVGFRPRRQMSYPFLALALQI